MFGELQDRIEFLLDSGKDVKRIEERMEEYRRNNKELEKLHRYQQEGRQQPKRSVKKKSMDRER